MCQVWNGCKSCAAATPIPWSRDTETLQDYLSKPVKGKLLEKVSSFLPGVEPNGGPAND